MQKENFNTAVTNPSLVGNIQMDSLKLWTDKYPFCQSLQLLFLKKLYAEGSIHYNDELKKVSIQALNRKQLYKSVIQVALQQKIKKVEKESEKSEVQIEKIEEEKKTENKKEKIEEREKAEDENIELKEADFSPLEKEILQQAIASSISLELEEEKRIENTKKIKNGSKIKVESKKTEEKINPTSKRSFSDWLKTSKEKKQPKKEELIDTSSLIDQFIQSDPIISAPKKEFFSPINMARLSLIDKNEFVTETLANIYAKQGDFNKAIQAYETLSLKFPEKKTYFAALIKKVKKSAEQK